MFPLDQQPPVTKPSSSCTTLLDMESGTIHPKIEPEVEPKISYCWSQSVLTEDSSTYQRFLTSNSPELNIHMESQDYQNSPDVFQQSPQRYEHTKNVNYHHTEADLVHAYNFNNEQPSQQYTPMEFAQTGPDCYYDNRNNYNSEEFPTCFSTDMNGNTNTSLSKSYDPNGSCSMVTLTQTKQEFTFNYNDTGASSCTFQINQCMFP